jgi:hypothetical protein
MHSKASAEKQYKMPSDYKDVEDNNKRIKKKKTEHSHHPKKNPPLTDRPQADHCHLK